jgi:hypothetical protein
VRGHEVRYRPEIGLRACEPSSLLGQGPLYDHQEYRRYGDQYQQGEGGTQTERT